MANPREQDLRKLTDIEVMNATILPNRPKGVFQVGEQYISLQRSVQRLGSMKKLQQLVNRSFNNGGVSKLFGTNPTFSKEAVTVINSFPERLTQKEANDIGLIVNMFVDKDQLKHVDTFSYFTFENSINSSWDWIRHLNYTIVADPEHIQYKGWLPNGTTQYINSNFTPSIDGVNYTLNDAHVEAYCYDNLSAVDFASLFGSADASNHLRTNQRIGVSQFRIWGNSGTFTSESGGGPYADMTRYGINRPDSATQKGFRNGESVVSASVPSTGVPSQSLYIGGFNSNGTATSFLNARISHFIAGGGFNLTALKTILDYSESLLIR